MEGATVCTAVLMSLQAFGMADAEVATGLDGGHHPRHHLAFGVVVEVDHHVAQKDHVKLAHGRQRRVQVDLAKLDRLRKAAVPISTRPS
jgi:hypothetical protein